MKSVWLWLAFLLLYGLFSMKTQAAGMVMTQLDGLPGSGVVAGSSSWSF